MKQSHPTVLCILDGLGLNSRTEGNAVALADTPVLDRLFKEFPNSTLVTHGERVGLPAGQMGNSEVGHLNIGAGRVVEQWLLRIKNAFDQQRVSGLNVFKEFASNIQSSKNLHLIGLYSQGGVHSHLEHLGSLLKLLDDCFTGNMILHLISDGRDTAPKQLSADLELLEVALMNIKRVQIGSLCGRFFAMDRDRRWERTERAYQAVSGSLKPLCESQDLKSSLLSLQKYIGDSYRQGITDEFLEPIVVTPFLFKESDSALFWNFRSDRMRQLVKAIALPQECGFQPHTTISSNERVLTFSEYDRDFPFPVLFPTIEVRMHLGETVAAAGLAQLRAAETEKYPHVTFFFNGGREDPFPGEQRILVPSPQEVKTYDQKPEMSAQEVTQKVIAEMKSSPYALVVLNFANCDMVGHTGVLEAAVKAVETVDKYLGQILKAVEDLGGQALIIADHGNAEQMIDYHSGLPHTAHTTFPVPIILVSQNQTYELRNDGALCDVAPTILEMMGLPQPEQMTGRSLLIAK